MKRNRGFTLLEIAVVVAITLTLLTLGLTAIDAQLRTASYSITKKRQDVIKDALIAYLGANKKLPCPIVPTSGTPVDGNAPSQSGTPPVCPSPSGVVPFKTLGLAREIGDDGWGNLFSYRVYSDGTPSCPGISMDWANANCFGEGKIGVLTVNDGTVALPTLLAANIVAVVISHGANGLGAWAAQGTRNAPPTTCEEAHNAVGTTAPAGCTPTANTYYKGERQENDDVVAYLTAAEAIQSLAKQGTIKSAMAKVNDDLQALYEQAVGLNLASPTCTIPSPAIRDPWGNLYALLPIDGSIPSCIYSTAVPTTCKAVEKPILDVYRNRAGSPPCP